MNLVYELEKEKEIEIENVVIENGYVVDRRTGEVIGRVYTY